LGYSSKRTWEAWMLNDHRAVVTAPEQLTAHAAELIDAETADGHPVVVLHPGAVEAAELALQLQERGRESLLHNGWVELVHRSGGTSAIRSAAARAAEHDTAPPHLVIINPARPGRA